LEWLSKTTGKPCRLLSESEREFVARAGTTTPFATGGTITSGHSNFDGRFVNGGSQESIVRKKSCTGWQICRE